MSLTDKLEAHEAIERVEGDPVEGYQDAAAEEAKAAAGAEARPPKTSPRPERRRRPQ